MYQLGVLTREQCGLPPGPHPPLPLPPDLCPVTSGPPLGEERKARLSFGGLTHPEHLWWSRPKVTIPQAHGRTGETPPVTVPTGAPLARPPALKAGNLPMMLCFVLGTLLLAVSLVLGVQWYRGRRARRGRWQ